VRRRPAPRLELWLVAAALGAGLALGGCAGESPPSEARSAAEPSGDETAPAWSGEARLGSLPAGASHVKLYWPPAGDDRRVTHYRVFRNGARVADVAGTTYLATLLRPNADYTFVVQAVDAAGNAAGRGLELALRTQPHRRLPVLPPGHGGAP
jgi:hypothetical protein